MIIDEFTFLKIISMNNSDIESNIKYPEQKLLVHIAKDW